LVMLQPLESHTIPAVFASLSGVPVESEMAMLTDVPRQTKTLLLEIESAAGPSM